jgi:predicted outer membrane repeat protein
MYKKLWLGLAVSLMLALPAQAALGATITLTSSCSFDKAVAWINAGTGTQLGCTKSGTFGSNDTIIVGLNYQAFSITSTVEIKKSLTVQNWWNYAYLNVTSASLGTAIKIAAPDILVNFQYIVLSGAPNNTTTGFLVEGRNPAVDAFATPKLTMVGCRITGFRRSGMRINQATVKMSNTMLDDNSNNSSVSGDGGGAVKIESTSTTYGRLQADDCFFERNTARRGGAIYNNGSLNLTNTSFVGNVATKTGGGGTGGVVYAKYVTGYYTNFANGNYFENNRADPNGYSIAASETAAAWVEFSSPPYPVVNNTTPLCNPDPLFTRGPLDPNNCPVQ